MKLAARIRTARRKAGLSQQQLADAIGVKRSAVANWECVEGAQPAVANLILLAKTVHVCFDWLATGRGEMQLSPYKYDSLVTDAELIEDPDERRLVHTWRQVPARMKCVLLELAEAMAPAARKPPPKS